jgi:hypothetical protein
MQSSMGRARRLGSHAPVWNHSPGAVWPCDRIPAFTCRAGRGSVSAAFFLERAVSARFLALPTAALQAGAGCLGCFASSRVGPSHCVGNQCAAGLQDRRNCFPSRCRVYCGRGHAIEVMLDQVYSIAHDSHMYIRKKRPPPAPPPGPAREDARVALERREAHGRREAMERARELENERQRKARAKEEKRRRDEEGANGSGSALRRKQRRGRQRANRRRGLRICPCAAKGATRRRTRGVRPKRLKGSPVFRSTGRGCASKRRSAQRRRCERLSCSASAT